MLIVVSYVLKGGGRKFQSYHYWAGWTAWGVMTFAIGFAFWTISNVSSTVEDFLFSLKTINLHFYWGLLLWGVMTLQAFMGEAMRRNPKAIMKVLRYHRSLSQVLLAALLALAVLGTPITYGLLEDSPTLQMIWVGASVLVWGVFAWMVWQTEINALVPRIKKKQTRVIERPKKEYQMRVFPEQEFVSIEDKESILRANLRAGIPHTHVCGGNARCSTCRIVVLTGLDNFGPRNLAEQRLADRLDFEPSIRLACQSRISGNVTFRRLVVDEIDIDIVNQLREDAQPSAVGHEDNIAVLFSDIRGFTRFSEDKLPYDVIHSLNRYFRLMGKVISTYGGHIHNYMGDGMLVVFDSKSGSNPSWQAVQAGHQMFIEFENVRTYFSEHFAYDIDMGLGIHFGSAVVGDVGAADQKQHTAIGDTVNYASRIESANKDAGTRFLVSQEVLDHVSDHVIAGRTHTFTPKGKTGVYTLYEISGLKS